MTAKTISKIKKLIYYISKISQVCFKNRFSTMRSILLLPSFDKKEDFFDQMSRLRWYVPEKYLNKNITVLVNEQIKDSIKVIKYPKSHRMNPSPDIFSRISIKYVGKNYSTPKSKIYCIWDFSFKKHINLLLKNLLTFRIIDPFFYKYTESHTYPALLWYDIYTPRQRSKLKKNSIKLFANFYLQNKSKTVILFGTGPSINSVFKKDYSNDTTIICNSIVKNDQLLHRIKPNAITFIDSVFHFGVSNYCERFIEDVVKTVKKYKSYCFINEVGGSLIYEHFPELREKLICFPTYRMGGPNRITPDNFKSRFYSHSVVTRIMLQLGAGLADKILMCGFDGRSDSEDYFWKHSPNVQYDDLMQDVWDTHPTFFSDTNYVKNYYSHCKDMESVINKLEHKGIKIYTTEKSFIPALAIRNYKKVS